MNRTFKGFVAAGVLAFSGTLLAQSGAPTAPEIAFDSVDLLKWDDAHIVGEVGGVGQDSKGRVFVYTRTGHAYATIGDNRTFLRNGSRLFQYDATGKFVRELGQDVYGFNAAFGLRVDPQDNVWTIDQGANQVVSSYWLLLNDSIDGDVLAKLQTKTRVNGHVLDGDKRARFSFGS